MAPPDSDQSAKLTIREAGWRQGSFIAAEMLSNLEVNAPAAFGAVVISQDCDVVLSSDDEPTIEIIVATKVASPDGNYTYGKNPRTLHVSATGPAAPVALQLKIHDRHVVPKPRFEGQRPSADLKLDTKETRLVAEWVAKRYVRPAFPDTFNERLRSVEDRLSKLFKNDLGRDVSALLVMLDHPDDELGAEQNYRIAVWVVSTDDVVKVATSMNKLELFKTKLAEILKDCRGIELVDIDLRSESLVTLADLREMKRLDVDHRSRNPKTQGQLPPEGV